MHGSCKLPKFNVNLNILWPRRKDSKVASQTSGSGSHHYYASIHRPRQRFQYVNSVDQANGSTLSLWGQHALFQVPFRDLFLFLFLFIISIRFIYFIENRSGQSWLPALRVPVAQFSVCATYSSNAMGLTVHISHCAPTTAKVYSYGLVHN